MAAATRSAFRVRFPQFDRVSDAMVDAFLVQAAESTPEDPWHEHQEEGHLYLTAHLISQSPNGNNVRKDDKGADAANTAYGSRYDRLKTMVACGSRVV